MSSVWGGLVITILVGMIFEFIQVIIVSLNPYVQMMARCQPQSIKEVIPLSALPCHHLCSFYCPYSPLNKCFLISPRLPNANHYSVPKWHLHCHCHHCCECQCRFFDLMQINRFCLVPLLVQAVSHKCSTYTYFISLGVSTEVDHLKTRMSAIKIDIKHIDRNG